MMPSGDVLTDVLGGEFLDEPREVAPREFLRRRFRGLLQALDRAPAEIPGPRENYG